ILIRAMALDDAFSRRRYIVRELGLGTSLAFIMGVLLFLVTLGWFGDPMLGLVLGVALFLAVIVAVLVALGMTFLLVSLKKDPAVGSGPFATIIIDLVTILIYFTIAALFLPVLG
ncbi:MAG: magnesium transporter, partial [Candidatus Paceibacterota bacterium]